MQLTTLDGVATLPDNQDYEDLAKLLAGPEDWTDNEAARARVLLAQQREALSAVHPKNEVQQQRMGELVAQIEVAIARYEAS